MSQITERARRVLYEAAEKVLGKEAADTLMAHLPPVGWADVATKSDLNLLRAELRAEIHQTTERQTRVFVTWTGALFVALAALELGAG